MTNHPRRHVLLPSDLFGEIDLYRHANRIDTRTEAICQLIRAGLEYTAPLDPAAITVTDGRANLHDQRPTAMKLKRPARLEKSASGGSGRP